MNWTGGARARANKASSGVAAKQKQYFAKVRAKMMSNAFMGGSSPDEGLSAIIQKRQKELHDFEIVVGAEKRPLGAEEEEGVGEAEKKRRKVLHPEAIPELGGREIATKKKEKLKSAKNALLRRGDWVCTSKTMAAPLNRTSREKQRTPFNARPITSAGASPFLERFPKARTTASSQAAITDVATEYDHLDTGFNAFRPLSRGGYVRIGKGKPPVTAGPKLSESAASQQRDISQESMLLEEEADRMVSDSPFQAIEEDEISIQEDQLMPRRRVINRYALEDTRSETFEPMITPELRIQKGLAGVPVTDQEFLAPSEEYTFENLNPEAYFTSSSVAPEQPQSALEQDLHSEETLTDVGIESGNEDDIFLSRNPPLPPPRFRLQPDPENEDFDQILRDIDEAVSKTPSLPKFPTPIELRRPRSKTQSSPTSYVTQYCARGVTTESSGEVQECGEDRSPCGSALEPENEPTNAESSVLVHASSSMDECASSEDVVEPTEITAIPEELPQTGEDNPWKKYFTFSASSTEDERESSVLAERGTTIEKEPEETPQTRPLEVITIASDTEFDTEDDSSEASQVMLVPSTSACTEAQPTTSEQKRPSVTLLDDAEEIAWRNFVFAGMDQDSSDEEEYVYNPPKKLPVRRNDAANTSTEISPYFPSSVRAERGSLTPMLPVSSRSSGSMSGNASSSPRVPTPKH
ncbi:hypothetical protein FN846DRAFT_912893 [Sphaerosporella brunnea]|uniref:Uncharacterized protein n=1 Tax=Sphaerosporella brunnea TaxID=1250544 RepID=A0A5J5EFJ4_9PEZI|nr:hypothetical protein FN846DRAFT_912893 [Sphaerosporella brunnea]